MKNVEAAKKGATPADQVQAVEAAADEEVKVPHPPPSLQRASTYVVPRVPTSVLYAGLEPAEPAAEGGLAQAISVLESYKHAMEAQQAAIAAQVREKEEQVATAFRDYNNVPYYLHAILIHDGTSDSGHYYSFIYDRKQQTWWRFSDYNVSIEVEEVVMEEAFGGQAASLKTAYALIYISEFCKKTMEEQPASPHQMGRLFDVSGELRNQVTIENQQFLAQFEQYRAKKKGDAVRNRFNSKKRHILEQQKSLDGILHVPLLNFIFHLHAEKKTLFCDWVCLNQACLEEIGPGMGLRAISRDANKLLFKDLSKDYKVGFLAMSEKDEKALEYHVKFFKDEKRRYAIVTFALKVYGSQLTAWKDAHSAIAFMRSRGNKMPRKEDSLEHLLTDLIKVYVLESLTTALKHVLGSQGELALRVLTGATIACYQFLPDGDPINK